MRRLCKCGVDVFLAEPNLLRLSSRSYVIVGDLHGHYKDLLRIFERHGMPPATNDVLLGDMVDRGTNGLEIICLLVALKLRHPDNIFILRGNHETADVTAMFGFRSECQLRSASTEDGLNTWEDVVALFNTLPLAAHIAAPHDVFCVHGGISPRMQFIDEIDSAAVRPVDVSQDANCLVTDLLWSDPCAEIEDWGSSPRGTSYRFGLPIVREFLAQNRLKRIVRGHTAQPTGFQVLGEDEVITIFSTSNYRGSGNDAAVLVLAADGGYSIDLLPHVASPRRAAVVPAAVAGCRVDPYIVSPCRATVAAAVVT